MDCDKEIICVDGKAERGTVQCNGRNPDIVSAYSFNAGIIPATEACHEKKQRDKGCPAAERINRNNYDKDTIDGILQDMAGYNNKISPYYMPRTSIEEIDGGIA